VPALRDATVTIPAGKVVALAGDNGAGKSALLRTLLGLERPRRGRGDHRRPAGRAALRPGRAGAGRDAVHQDLAIAPGLSVVDNMFLGHEDVGGRTGRTFGVLARRRMSERAAVALRDLSIRLPSH
jgi:ABC-type sugar transport system ATPase subunit